MKQAKTDMKHKLLLLVLFALLLAYNSCGRKSGRREQTAKRQSGSSYKENHTQSPTNSIRNPNDGINSSKENTKSRSLTAPEIFEKYNSAVFMILTSDGYSNYQGSGFFISPDGIAVSNFHVFKDTYLGLEQIKLVNGSIYQIKNIIASSEDEDIIIFKVESTGRSFNYIPISNRKPKVGEKTFAIGSPRGLENTFSSGEISQFRGNDFIQITVPIDHGSSGGALLNVYGEAIGITTAGMDKSNANLNFAVSIDVIRKYLR